MDGESAPWMEIPSNWTQAQILDHRHATKRWWRAIIIALFWLVALSLLSLLTANPVTLNRMQILEADDVVRASVEDWTSGRMRIEKSWKKRLADESVQIMGLPKESQLAGTKWLIPVTRERDDWIVAPSPMPNGQPLIYPATPEAERQLQSLLDTGRLSP